MKEITVRNMVSPGSFKNVPNQFIITTNRGTYFQSYQTIIAKRDNNGNITLNNEWTQSNTTGKYRNQFLNEVIAITREKVKSGEYKLANLNQ